MQFQLFGVVRKTMCVRTLLSCFAVCCALTSRPIQPEV